MSAERPRIVCLCGSTRFYQAFQETNYRETMAGRIVLSVGHYPNSDGSHGEQVGCTPEQKIELDKLHKQKIDISDEILVLNVGGYIGDSTRGEVDHAIATRKPIRWLERDKIPPPYKRCTDGDGITVHDFIEDRCFKCGIKYEG